VHGGGQRTYARLTQRLDGFVALTAKTDSGTALTRPLRFAGDRLQLNAAVQGRVRVALLGTLGTPVPGYALQDCDPVRGDATAISVSWKGNSQVATLAGQPVQVLFELRQAQLFAFQFTRADGGTGHGLD
jgi:hypothetical protein